MGWVLGVDVGASRLRVGLYSIDEARLVAKKMAPTPRSGDRMAVARRIVELAESLFQERGFTGDLEGVGVSSIGPLDLARGEIVGTPNNPLRPFPMRDPLEKRFRTRVRIANDCVAAVWGEKVLGEGGRYTDLAYITISSGIGGGFIVSNRLIEGRRGNAHEVGHLVVEVDSNLRCGCGGRGHWEALASGSALPRLATLHAAGWRGPMTPALELARRGSLDPPLLYKLAREGDKFALSVVRRTNRYHAAGLAGVIAAYDPEVIFMGGSVFLENQDLILPDVVSLLEDYSLYRKPPPLRPATFGHDAPLMGAIGLVLYPPEDTVGKTAPSSDVSRDG